MILPNWYQMGDTGSVAFAAAGNSTTVIKVALGSTRAYRLFALDVVLDDAINTRGRFSLRDGTGYFARGGFGGNQPSDHCYFGEGGYLCAPNTNLSLFLSVQAACDVYWTLRYLIEG